MTLVTRFKKGLGLFILALWAFQIQWAMAQERPNLAPIPEIATQGLSVPIQASIGVAKQQLDEALEADVDVIGLARAYGQLGDVLLVHGLVTPARVAYENAQRLEPRRLDWPYLLSVIATDQGKTQAAMDLLNRALEIDAWDRASLVRRGRLALSEGQWDEAQRDFTRVLQLAPDSAAALAGLGELALQRQDFATAARQLEAALERQPTASRLYQPLALAYRGMGELDKARSFLGATGDRDVAFLDPVMDLVREKSQSPQFYQEAALVAAETGDLLSARTLLVQALSLSPNDPLIITNYGEVLAREGLLPQAQEAFTRLVELEPNNPEAWFYLAQTAELMGSLDAAEGAYRRMGSLAGESRRSEEGLAFVALAKGEYRRAVDAFSALAGNEADDAERYRLRYWHAIALVGVESYDEALELLETLDAESEGSDPDVVLAHARLMASVTDGSADSLQRVLDNVETIYQSAPNADSAATLAMVHARLGEFFDAQDYQAQAMFEVLREGELDQRTDLKEEMDWYRQEQPASRPFGQTHPVFTHRSLN